MSDTRYRDADWLEEQYHEKELSQYEIADKCGVYDTTVGKWMKKHDIEKRGTSGDVRYKDAEWLHEQYHDKGLTQHEVADKCDVKPKAVCRWMEKHGIERRAGGHTPRSDKPTGQLTLDDTRKLEGAQTVNQ